MVKDNTFVQFVPREIKDLGPTKREFDLEQRMLQNHSCDFLELIAKGKENIDQNCPSGISEYLVFYRCPKCEKLYYEDSPVDGIFTRMTQSKIFYQGSRTKDEIMLKIPNLFCDEGLRYIQGRE